MVMSKFKVGDKIKVVQGFYEGYEGIVTELISDEKDGYGYTEYCVKLLNHPEKKFDMCFKEFILEKVEMGLFEKVLYNPNYDLYSDPEYITNTDESLTEMATVAIDKKKRLRIQVNPDRNRVGEPYFKVFDTSSPKPNQSRVARLRFKDEGMEYHNDKYLNWKITAGDIDVIKEFLMRQHEDFQNYTNWQMACYLWNYEYGFDISRDKYFKCEFDDKYSDHSSYVRSDTKMPDTWVYNHSKAKSKRSKLTENNTLD